MSRKTPRAIHPVHPADGKCGAKTKASRRCSHPAGFRTPHPGAGRCYLHGGMTPVKHGRYSSLKRESLRDLIAQHEADPDPLNILPELAAARALFQDFVERYDAWREALLAWHASFDAAAMGFDPERLTLLGRVLDEYEHLVKTGEPTPAQLSDLEQAREAMAKLNEPSPNKPRMVLDVADAYRIVSEVTKIAERIERVRAANAVSRPEMIRIMTEMGRIVALHVHDVKTREAIQRDWVSIVRVG